MHMTLKPEKKQKYRNKKTPCRHGHTHDSGKEARRCNDLHMLQRAGVITDLEQQPKYLFAINGVPVTALNGRQLRFTPDFRYHDGGQLIVEDTKGMRTTDYQLRAAFFRALHPDIVLRET